MGDPFTGGNHEAWDKPAPEIGGTVIQVWSNWCVACKGYPQEHSYDERCFLSKDYRMPTSDPDCEED
jgi:hypothetical protein